VIVQDVLRVFPDAVEGAPNIMSVDYDQLLGPVIEAIKELKAANDNLVSETVALNAQLKAANDNHAKDAAAIEELRLDMRDVKRAAAKPRR
jgi:hypothetical protein